MHTKIRKCLLIFVIFFEALSTLKSNLRFTLIISNITVTKAGLFKVRLSSILKEKNIQNQNIKLNKIRHFLLLSIFKNFLDLKLQFTYNLA